MDIPLPGEDDPPPPPGDEEYEKLLPPPPFPRALLRCSESPPDLMVFESGDSNKYSPSHVTAEEEHPAPSLKTATQVGPTRTAVLGKAQAKRRLLAFSAAKLAKKPAADSTAAVKEATGDMADVKDQDGEKKKKKKKVPARVEKERAIIASIEQLKREEIALRGPNYRLPYYDTSNTLARPKDDLDLLAAARDKNMDIVVPVDENEKSKESSESKSRSRHGDKRHNSRDRERNRDKDRDRSKPERRRSKEKPRKPTELPVDWNHFKSRGYKFDDIRQLKYKMEEKERDNARRRHRYRRSRSHEDKKHRRSPHTDDINKPCEDEKDYIFRLFVHPPKPYYPYIAVGLDSKPKEYPRVLVRLTKTQPRLTVCENPNISTKYYKTKEAMFLDSSPELVEIMKIVIENRTHEYYSRQSDDDSNIASGLAALQVSYDEDDMDDNLSTDDVSTGKKRERSWFLPEAEWFVTSVGNETVKIEENTDNVEKNEVKEKEQTPERSLPREVKVSEEAVTEDLKENSKSPYDETFETETENILETSTSVRVRSKWDSDYEEDHVDSPHVPEVTAVKEEETPISSPVVKENLEEDSRVSVVNEEESLASNSGGNVVEEPSDIKLFETGDDNMELSEGEIEERNVIIEESINEPKIVENVPLENAPFSEFLTDQLQASKSPVIAPEGTADFKLVSEYEEFMKAVSFDAVNNSESNSVNENDGQTLQENGDSSLNEIPSNEQNVVSNASCLQENEVSWESEMKQFINEKGPFEGIEKDFEKLSNKIFDDLVPDESQSQTNSLFENIIKKSDSQNRNITLSVSDGYRNSEEIIPGIGDDDVGETSLAESEIRLENTYGNGTLNVRNEKHTLEGNDQEDDDEDDEYAESVKSNDEDDADLETDSDTPYDESSKLKESNNIMIAKMALKDLEKKMKKESKTSHKKKKKLTKKKHHKHESKRKRSRSSSSDDSSSDSETSDSETKISKRKTKKRKKRKKKKTKYIHSDSSEDSSSSSSSTTSSTTSSSSPPPSPSESSDSSSSDEAGTKKRKKGKKSKKRKSKKGNGKHKKGKKTKKSHKKRKSRGEAYEDEGENFELGSEIANNKQDKSSEKKNKSLSDKQKHKSSERRIARSQDREINKQSKSHSKKSLDKKHKEYDNESLCKNSEEEGQVSRKHKRKRKKDSKNGESHSPDTSKYKNSDKTKNRTLPKIGDSNSDKEQSEKCMNGKSKLSKKEHHESELEESNKKQRKEVHKKLLANVEKDVSVDSNYKTETKGEDSCSKPKMDKVKRNYRTMSSRNESSEEEKEQKNDPSSQKNEKIKFQTNRNYKTLTRGTALGKECGSSEGEKCTDNITGRTGMPQSYYSPVKPKTDEDVELRKSFIREQARPESQEKNKNCSNNKHHKPSKKDNFLYKVKAADEDPGYDSENDCEREQKRQDLFGKRRNRNNISKSDVDNPLNSAIEHRKKQEKHEDSTHRSSSRSKSREKKYKSKADKTVWESSEDEEMEKATYKSHENETNKSYTNFHDHQSANVAIKNEHKKHKKKKKRRNRKSDEQIGHKETSDTDTETEKSSKKHRRKHKLHPTVENKKSKCSSSTSSEHTPTQTQNSAEENLVRCHKSISSNEEKQEKKRLRYNDGPERKKSHKQEKKNKEQKGSKRIAESDENDLSDLLKTRKHDKKKKKVNKVKNREKFHKKSIEDRTSKVKQKQKNKDDYEGTDFDNEFSSSEARQKIKEKNNCESIEQSGNEHFSSLELGQKHMEDNIECNLDLEKEIKQETFSEEEWFDEMSYDYDMFAVKQEPPDDEIPENVDNCEMGNFPNYAFSSAHNSDSVSVNNITTPSSLQREKECISDPNCPDLISDLSFDWSQSVSGCEKPDRKIFHNDVCRNITSLSLSSSYSDNAQMPFENTPVSNNDSDQHITQQKPDSEAVHGVLLSDKSLVLYSPGEESDDGDNDNFEASVSQNSIQNSTVKDTHVYQSNNSMKVSVDSHHTSDSYKQSSDVDNYTVSNSITQPIFHSTAPSKTLSNGEELSFLASTMQLPLTDNLCHTGDKNYIINIGSERSVLLQPVGNTENLQIDNLLLSGANTSNVNNAMSVTPCSPVILNMEKNTPSKNYTQKENEIETSVLEPTFYSHISKPESFRYDTYRSSLGYLPSHVSSSDYSPSYPNKYTNSNDISRVKNDHQRSLNISIASINNESQVSSSTGKIDEKLEKKNVFSSVQLEQVSSSETTPKSRKCSRWGMTTALPKKVADISGKFENNVKKGFIHNRDNLNLKEFTITESSSVYQLDSAETETFFAHKENTISETDFMDKGFSDVSNKNNAKYSDNEDDYREREKTRELNKFNETDYLTPLAGDAADTKEKTEKFRIESNDKSSEKLEGIINMCDKSQLAVQIENAGKVCEKDMTQKAETILIALDASKECNKDGILETKKMLTVDEVVNEKKYEVDYQEWKKDKAKDRRRDSKESVRDRDYYKESKENIKESNPERQERERDREDSKRRKIKESSRYRRDSSGDRKESNRRRRDSSRDRKDLRRDKQDSNRDRRESYRERRDSSRDRRESYRDRRDSSRDRKESYRDKQNSSKDDHNSSTDRHRQELNANKRESRKEKYETSRNRRELSRDRQELCGDMQKLNQDIEQYERDRLESSVDGQKSSKDILESSIGKQESKKLGQELDKGKELYEKERHYSSEEGHDSSKHTLEFEKGTVQNENKFGEIRKIGSSDTKRHEHVEKKDREHDNSEPRKHKENYNKKDSCKQQQKSKDYENKDRQSTERKHSSGNSDISVEKEKMYDRKDGDHNSMHYIEQLLCAVAHESENTRNFQEIPGKEIHECISNTFSEMSEKSDLNCENGTYKTCKESSVVDSFIVTDPVAALQTSSRLDQFSIHDSKSVPAEELYERIVQYISPESDSCNQNYSEDCSYGTHINMEEKADDHNHWDKKETNAWTDSNLRIDGSVYYDKNLDCNYYNSSKNQSHFQETNHNIENNLLPSDSSICRFTERSPVKESRKLSPKRSPSPKLKRNLSPTGRFRSPTYRCNQSPVYRQSPSPPRHDSRRRRSRSPVRKRSSSPSNRKSPVRKRSRSPVHKWNKNHARRRSRSPLRKRSRSPLRKHSRSPIRKRSRSPLRKHSRSPVRKRSRSPVRKRSRSPVRKRSRSPVRKCSGSPVRKRSRSPLPKRNRSPLCRRSHSNSRSPVRKKTEILCRHNQSPSSRYRQSPAGKRRYSQSPTRSLSPRESPRPASTQSKHLSRRDGSPISRRTFSRSSVSPYRHSSPSPKRRLNHARSPSPMYKARRAYSPCYNHHYKSSSPLPTCNEGSPHSFTRYGKSSSPGKDHNTNSCSNPYCSPILEKKHLSSRSPSPFIKHNISSAPNYTHYLSPSVQEEVSVSALNSEEAPLPQTSNIPIHNNQELLPNYILNDSSVSQSLKTRKNCESSNVVLNNLKPTSETTSVTKNMKAHDSNLQQQNPSASTQLPVASIGTVEASSPISSPLTGIKLSVADSTISDSELLVSNKQDVKSTLNCISSICKLSKSSNKDIKMPQTAAKTISHRRGKMKVERKRDRNISHSPSPEFSPRRLSLDERIKLELESAEPKVSHPPVEMNSVKHSVFSSPSKKHCPSSRQAVQPSVHPALSLKISQPHIPNLPQQMLHEAAAPVFTVPPPGYTTLPPLYTTPPPAYTPSLVGHNLPPTYQTSHPAYQQIQSYNVTGYPVIPHNPYEMHASTEKHFPQNLHYNVQNMNEEHIGVPSSADPITSSWDTPEAFIGNGSYLEQNSSSAVGNNLPTSKVVQVGNVLQVVPVDLPKEIIAPVPPPVAQTSTKQLHAVREAAGKQQITSENKQQVLSSMPTVNKAASIQNWIQTGVPTAVPPPAVTPPVTQPPNLHLKPAPVKPVPQPASVVSFPVSTTAAPVPKVAVTMTLSLPSVVPSTMISQVQSYHNRLPPTVQVSVTQAPGPVPLTSTPAPVLAATNPVTVIPSLAPVIKSQVSTMPLPTVSLPVPVSSSAPERTQPVVFSKRDLLKHLPLPVAQSRIKLLLAAETQKLIEEEKRIEREKRKEEREKRKQEKELKKQERLKLKLSTLTTENILKKALLQDRDLLDEPEDDSADIDLQEMRLIEEAMAEVPEMDEEEEDIIKMRKTIRKKKLKVITVEPLPAAGKGILVSPGFRDKSLDTSLQKTVKFADGIHPGEGTSPSGGEDLPSPPPPPRKLPKEKRYKKKKNKNKKLKFDLEDDDDDDDEDDDCSPPPPPPGPKPPHLLYGATFTGTYPATSCVFSKLPSLTVLPSGVDVGSPHTPLYTPPYQPSLAAATAQFTVPALPTLQS